MRSCLRRSKLELRGPGDGLKSDPTTLKKRMLQRLSRRYRICRRSGLADVPEALLGWARGRSPPGTGR
eukprot:1072033-Alexandrium_andersonii.AAC.1